MLKHLNFIIFLILSVFFIVSSLFLVNYFIEAYNKKAAPALEFSEDFSTKNYIDENHTSLNLMLEEGLVQLPYQSIEDLSSYINSLPDFRRITAIGTNGDDKFIIVVEASFSAGGYPVILEYDNKNGWKDITPAIKEVLDARNIEIQVIKWADGYWLLGGDVFNTEYNSYCLIKYQGNKFENLTKFLPKTNEHGIINSLAYASEKNLWLIGAWHNNGTYLIEYDGKEKFELVFDSQKALDGPASNFQVQSMDSDGSNFLIGCNRSTTVTIYNDIPSASSLRYVVGGENDAVTLVKYDERFPRNAKWLLFTDRGFIVETNLSALRTTDEYLNFHPAFYTEAGFSGNDFLMMATEDEKQRGQFLKMTTDRKIVDLSNIIPKVDLPGLRFMAIGKDNILVGNSKNLFSLNSSALFVKSGIVQSKPIVEQIKWYQSIKEVSYDYEGSAKDGKGDNSIKFYFSTDNGKNWEEFLAPGQDHKVTAEGNNLAWKAEFMSKAGDTSPVLKNLKITYQLGFSEKLTLIIIILAFSVEALLLFVVSYFFFLRNKIR